MRSKLPRGRGGAGDAAVRARGRSSLPPAPPPPVTSAASRTRAPLLPRPRARTRTLVHRDAAVAERRRSRVRAGASRPTPLAPRPSRPSLVSREQEVWAPPCRLPARVPFPASLLGTGPLRRSTPPADRGLTPAAVRLRRQQRMGVL